MKDYEGICQEYEKYVKNMKKYVNILDLAFPYLYGPWDLEKFHARASSWALGLEKIPRRSLLLSSGTWKNSEFCLYTDCGI